MAFREPAAQPKSGCVTYGPFPLRAGHLAFSALLLFVAPVVAATAFARDDLICAPACAPDARCAPACAPDARCIVMRALPPMTVEEFPRSALRDVRLDVLPGSKGSSLGKVVLVLDDGREIPLRKVSRETADEVVKAIRAGLARNQWIDVTLRGPWWALPFALVFLGMGLTMARSAVRGRGRFRIEITHGGAGLRVRRELLGIPVSSRDVPLEGVVDVRVEDGTLHEVTLRKGEAPSPAGRIVLVDRSGATRPLTADYFRGQAVHLRAAAELRALLGLDPLPHGVEERLASLPPVTTPLRTRVAMAGLGLSVGYLAGLGLLIIVGAALGLLRMSDSMEGWHVAIGGGGGASAGVAVALYLTRRRPPR